MFKKKCEPCLATNHNHCLFQCKPALAASIKPIWLHIVWCCFLFHSCAFLEAWFVWVLILWQWFSILPWILLFGAGTHKICFVFAWDLLLNLEFWFDLNMAEPAEVKAKIDGILQRGQMGPIQQWMEIKSLLISTGLAYEITAKADSFVAHPKNRSTTLISPHNMHRKGQEIIKKGADLGMLQNSVCTSFQLTLLWRMHLWRKISTKHLAPVLGSERYATLSSGHTTQFVKALMSEAETPIPELGDPSGHHGSKWMEVAGASPFFGDQP